MQTIILFMPIPKGEILNHLDIFLMKEQDFFAPAEIRDVLLPYLTKESIPIDTSMMTNVLNLDNVLKEYRKVNHINNSKEVG